MHGFGRALSLGIGANLVVCGFFLLYLGSCRLCISSIFGNNAGSRNGGLLRWVGLFIRVCLGLTGDVVLN